MYIRYKLVGLKEKNQAASFRRGQNVNDNAGVPGAVLVRQLVKLDSLHESTVEESKGSTQPYSSITQFNKLTLSQKSRTFANHRFRVGQDYQVDQGGHADGSGVVNTWKLAMGRLLSQGYIVSYRASLVWEIND